MHQIRYTKLVPRKITVDEIDTILQLNDDDTKFSYMLELRLKYSSSRGFRFSVLVDIALMVGVKVNALMRLLSLLVGEQFDGCISVPEEEWDAFDETCEKVMYSLMFDDISAYIFAQLLHTHTLLQINFTYDDDVSTLIKVLVDKNIIDTAFLLTELTNSILCHAQSKLITPTINDE